MPVETTSSAGRVRGDTGLGRLTRRREFVAAAKGRRHHTPLLSLQAIARDVEPLPGGTALRVGLTVTRKAGHATERNRIRRRLKAALHGAGAPHRDWPADLVVVARREILTAPFGRLAAELADAISAIARKTRRAGPSDPDAAAAPRPGAADPRARRRGRGLGAKPNPAKPKPAKPGPAKPDFSKPAPSEPSPSKTATPPEPPRS